MSSRRLIFLSYARKDGAVLARRLCADLGAAGYEVWLDREQVAGGSSWSREIERAIERARHGGHLEPGLLRVPGAAAST
jgi:hypothetical protein